MVWSLDTEVHLFSFAGMETVKENTEVFWKKNHD